MSDSTIVLRAGRTKLVQAGAHTVPATDSEAVPRLAKPLRNVAVFLEAFAIVAAHVGVLAGFVLAAQTRSAFGFDGAHTNHPYVVPGVAVAVLSIVAGLFFWCVARTAHVVAAKALPFSVQ